MNRLKLLAAALAPLALVACASFDPVAFAEAANTLDPHCGKRVSIKATPMLIFGFPLPVFSGEYDKQCEPTPRPPAVQVTPQDLQAGRVLNYQ